MRDLIVDTYWLPLKVTSRLGRRLLLILPAFPLLLIATMSDLYIAAPIVLIVSTLFFYLQWKLMATAINHDQQEQIGISFNTDIVWYFGMLLVLTIFTSYLFLHLLALSSVITTPRGSYGFVSATGDWIENLPAFIVVYGVTALCLNFLGTSLPAVLTARGQGPTAALKRGWRGIRWLGPRVLLGPAALLALQILFPMLGSSYDLIELLHGTSASIDQPFWAMLLGLTLRTLGMIQAFVLLAVAYRRFEPQEEQHEPAEPQRVA